MQLECNLEIRDLNVDILYFTGRNDVNTGNQISSEKSDEGHYAVNGTGSGALLHIDLKERGAQLQLKTGFIL